MSPTTSRRSFLKTATAGAAAVSMSTASYARVVGANDRLSIAVIGCGQRGFGAHMPGVHKYADSENMEITAVSDPWRLPRERASAQTNKWYGRPARQFVSHRDIMTLKDVDAVMIASCDHQHTTQLIAAAKANKPAYCEKPLARDMKSLLECYDAVKQSGIVCQIGTQGRSRPGPTGCKKLYKTGVLGTVSRIEQRRNSTRPYWYSRLKEAKKSDVEWGEFLMDEPARPFDAELLTGWFGYRDFSDGPVPQLATHFLDMVHYVTGATLPTSCVALGGIFTYKDEHNFTCPDHVESTWIYPEGFMVSYTTNFGNSSGRSYHFYGSGGVMDLSSHDAPTVSGEGAAIRGELRDKVAVDPVEVPDHFLNWLQCIRSGKTPNASIEAGYQHSIASIMSVQAMDTGRRQIYDHQRREIRAG
ncbi:MAG TPA: Gfo/Idh/MocA family oxidoreductase [Pirellulaceae bacterium]|nr:Gfo/Idh/MocA family oxidoreductase [Pirellulaceae bacterium]